RVPDLFGHLAVRHRQCGDAHPTGHPPHPTPPPAEDPRTPDRDVRFDLRLLIRADQSTRTARCTLRPDAAMAMRPCLRSARSRGLPEAARSRRARAGPGQMTGTAVMAPAEYRRSRAEAMR